MGPIHRLKSLLLVTLTILLATGIRPIKGQSETDPIESSSELISPTVLRICADNDPLSNAHCKCDNNVISCDFSNYDPTTNNEAVPGNVTNNSSSLPTTTTATQAIELDIYGYQFPPNTSRFCICNTPPTMNLTFSTPHFLPFPTNNIYRFDLYNLRGVTKFLGGFSRNFQGDLFIANVSFIPDIEGFEFGRGSGEYDSEHIPNLQDLQCCSPIKINQQQNRPLLLIENTTIGLIHTRGLNDIHLWKTLIMKSVHIKEVQELGVNFDSYPGYNVSIMGCKFENVQKFGLIFKDPLNLLMVKNYFTRSTSPASWWSRSSLNDSNILLMDNIFWNGQILNMDAQKVISWGNIHDLWDNYTFYQMRYTEFQPKSEGGIWSQREIYFKYNLIQQGSDLNNSLDFGGSQAIFEKNVIGTCNCSFLNWTDEFLKPEDNYCFTGSIARDRDVRGKCSIYLEEAMEECSIKEDDPSTDFGHFCEDMNASIPGLPGVGMNLSEDAVDARINSNFMSLIIYDFQSFFELNKIQIGQIVYYAEVEAPEGGANKTRSCSWCLSVPGFKLLLVLCVLLNVCPSMHHVSAGVSALWP